MDSPRESGVITSSLPHTSSKGIFSRGKFVVEVIDPGGQEAKARCTTQPSRLVLRTKSAFTEFWQARRIGGDDRHQLIDLLRGLRRENSLIEAQLEFHAGTIKQHQPRNQIGPVERNLAAIHPPIETPPSATEVKWVLSMNASTNFASSEMNRLVPKVWLSARSQAGPSRRRWYPARTRYGASTSQSC